MAKKNESVTLDHVEISFLGIKGKWVADRAQMIASWQMYVELVTRVAVQPLDSDEGLLREALTSLHSLFGETRRVLREGGPGLARPMKAGSLTFAEIAIDVLNKVVRPFLSKWHPLLQAHEQGRPSDRAPQEHERAWGRFNELAQELNDVQEKLGAYAGMLAQAASVKAVH